jgi:hypothetical protein
MNRIVLHSRVGTDGVLHITVPMDEADAGREVAVTIEPAECAASPRTSKADWEQFVRETAGAWQGELVRPPQGEYERREELP